MQGETPWHEDGGKGEKIGRKFPLGVSFFFISFFHPLFSAIPIFFFSFPFLPNFYSYSVVLIFATSTFLSVSFSSVLQLVPCSILYILVLCTPTTSTQCVCCDTHASTSFMSSSGPRNILWLYSVILQCAVLQPLQTFFCVTSMWKANKCCIRNFDFIQY